MTAEEYLDDNKREHFYPGHTYYYVSLEDALKAVNMAREEVKSSADKLIEATRDNVKMISDVGFKKQAVIAALQGYCANPHETLLRLDIKEIAELSVKQADELIKALG